MDTIVSSIVTLAATFLGAWYAFKLEKNDREQKTVADNVAAGNRALFMLLRQFNELVYIQKQHIDPVRERPRRFLAMRPLLDLDYEQLRFDVASLSFLLETPHREILAELLIEEGRFHSAIQALNERSRLHLQQVQPLLEKAGIVEGGEYTNEQLESALGNRLFLHLERATDEVIEHIDQTVESLLEMGKKLRSALKDLYPHATFIGFGK